MSNFRKIRPSFGENSPSTGNPSQSTSESTGSDPRRPRGDKDTPDASSTSSSKRRRVPESVTRNACLNCKKARAKCDGKKPCKRCATRVETSECIYEVHIKHAKEELVKQIKELRAKDHMTEQILQALSTDEKVPEILDRLKRGETYDSIVEWLGRSPMGEFETLSPRDSHLSLLDASDHEMTGVPANNWTTVTSNTAILDHLFQLYFAWVHPVHTLFSEPRFVESYQRWLDNFCSPVLVNAICAMACHLHTAADGDEVDYEQLGVEFSDAVRATLDPSDCRLTSIQAFAVMYLVDCARGHALRAVSYLKTATEYLPAVAFQDTDGFGDSWKDTVRGIRNLNIEWAQMTFQAPPIIDLAAYDGVEANDANQDIAKWYIYRYAKQQPEAWPSLLATTNREKSKLNAILQDIALMIYTRRDIHISAKQFLHQYERLKKWREGLPDEIGNIEGQDRPVLPHVLYLLIIHTTAVVQLLRPLLDFKGFPSSLVEETIWTCAQEGLMLLDRYYRAQYTFRYQPVLQILAALQLTDVIARFFPGGAAGGSKDGAEAVQFGMELLVESRVGFPIAGPLQEMLRRSANECAILLPRNLTELMQSPKPPQQVYRIDDFLGACGRSTYVQPNFETHQRYSPSFSSEWSSLGHIYGFRESTTGARRLRVPSAEERGAQSLMQIRNLLNTN
ncbi:uncharacterized protein L3040_001793 [Drepanopeziza brunnea f. sp. 'multigermtubi']|uniref:uncharacterized protein n=1 Tax=Drepanopeziza brunnea f. sp. 'multigermtubi' TaxID=698441 RepID=UPI0023A0B4D2|nr:hypothetical protein L3040_001793 [Drepanopeziza brunnea f. sp. 'multigermtubi']